MDWLELQKTLPKVPSLPGRCQRLLNLASVLDGTMYNWIKAPFSEERNDANEYVPLSQRRPSVRTHLIKTVMEDCTSLLFGDGHFPTVTAQDTKTQQVLGDFIRCAGIESVMIQAAQRAWLGSVALLVELQNHKPVVRVMDTAYLTPVWNRSTGALDSVTELYKTRGADLKAIGFDIPAENAAIEYWWQRRWDTDRCVVYTPSYDGFPTEEDASRTTLHGLGFVPIVWVRTNDCSGASDYPDGPCLFECAIDNQIEVDYTLSQSGRGLKYSADPALVIKSDPNIIPQDPGVPMKAGGSGGAQRVGGAASTLDIGPQGDAKLLEINGTASSAMIKYAESIRAVILEQMHGNRVDANKLSAAQSGRAMEMMSLGLIWMAGRLREPLGNGGLLALLRMVCDISLMAPKLTVDGKDVGALDADGLGLLWPKWFEPTPQEVLSEAQGLVTAVDGGLISNETACAVFCSRLGLEDATEEWVRVQAMLSDKAAQAAQSQGQIDAKNTRKDALSGSSLSHKVQA